MSLQKELKEAGIELDERFWHLVANYKQLLLEWNRVHSLTALKESKQLDAAIYDALYPLSFLPTPKRYLDVGTGAGFPGLLLGMAWEQSEVVLCEPLAKRASFLQLVAAKLGLEHIKVQRKRVEQLEPTSFDLITSRAVDRTSSLLELTKRVRDEETLLLFYKGKRVFEELVDDLKHRVIITPHRHYLLIGERIDGI